VISSYTVVVPMRLPSVANLREHWAVKMRRARAQRFAGRVAGTGARLVVPSPWAVTLTRISPRPLDSDNLEMALKAVRDGVADALELVSDRSPDATWKCEQRRGGPGESAVEISVAHREDNEP